MALVLKHGNSCTTLLYTCFYDDDILYDGLYLPVPSHHIVFSKLTALLEQQEQQGKPLNYSYLPLLIS